MPQTRNAWILWTMVACSIVVAFGWYFGVSPNLEERDVIVAETEELTSANDILDIEVSALRAQFAELDIRKAELASLQVPLPNDVEIASLLSELDTVAGRTEVALTDVVASSAVTVAPAVEVAPAPASAPEATTAGADETPSEVAAAPAPSAVEPLVAIPLSLTAFGTYDEITIFLQELQNSTSRYVLVASMQVDAAIPGPESSGVPEVAEGDVKIVLVAYAFAYADASDQASRILESAEVLPLPVRPDGRSQFRPVEGP